VACGDSRSRADPKLQYLEKLAGKAVHAQFGGGDLVKGKLEAIHDDVIVISGAICVIAQIAWIKPQK
jgi:hypothetical protein